MTLEIIPDSDPRLHTRIPEYDFSAQSKEDRAAMIAALTEKLDELDAIGIAANQCGLTHRVFIIRDEMAALACFNPRASLVGDERAIDTEGCLTFPDLWLKIERPLMIEAHWQDADGEEVLRVLHGYLARAFLHELDHLNGIVFTSKVSKLALDMARKKQRKRR